MTSPPAYRPPLSINGEGEMTPAQAGVYDMRGGNDARIPQTLHVDDVKHDESECCDGADDEAEQDIACGSQMTMGA